MLIDARQQFEKEQEFHDSEITLRVCVKADGQEKTITVVLHPTDSAAKKLKIALGQTLGDWPEILSVEWTHRHYVADDEYIPHGEDIAALLERQIAKPIIRWEDSPQLGYEILPNKYFYRYQPAGYRPIWHKYLSADGADWPCRSRGNPGTLPVVRKRRATVD
jgi:hypothetical protein